MESFAVGKKSEWASESAYSVNVFGSVPSFYWVSRGDIGASLSKTRSVSVPKNL